MGRLLDGSTGWAAGWQTAWNDLEEGYIPDRELRISALLDVVDIFGGATPTVLDLACGTGTITCRLLQRFPQARSICVDVDPALLAIASATFANDERVRIVRADLLDSRWADAVAIPTVDVVLTATALHWLPEDIVRRVYRDLARLIRPRGALAHAEEMPLVDSPRIATELANRTRRRMPAGTEGRASWDAWWEQVARDPALEDAMMQRRVVFKANYPSEEFSPPAVWHIAALRDAGFAEAAVVSR